LYDLAALAPFGPFVEAALVVDQRYVPIARVGAQWDQPGRGPVIAAALDQTAVSRAMELEQGHAIHPRGDSEPGQEIRDDIAPIPVADDAGGRIRHGLQHLRAAAQFEHCLPAFGEIVEAGYDGRLAAVDDRPAGERQPEFAGFRPSAPDLQSIDEAL